MYDFNYTTIPLSLFRYNQYCKIHSNRTVALLYSTLYSTEWVTTQSHSVPFSGILYSVPLATTSHKSLCHSHIVQYSSVQHSNFRNSRIFLCLCAMSPLHCTDRYVAAVDSIASPQAIPPDVGAQAQ